ncbi:DUF2163 domain-containing protein [Eleftheria terrae]|uniref:DUF2163 domain-containing protein n=1 Tax=Eleftheria terrae TaxID=1597781 RepID=UPI00263A99E3|nr:DUF2163 domain-containing protein [Eleftheria terrae]WKB50771.1 DUF2163 domain-containing protein [Eleftheria terrae]
MNYLEQDQSMHAGQPQELYRFAQEHRRWCYTSGQVPVTYQSETYEPAPISRSNIEHSNELSRSGLEVQVPRDLPLAALFVAAPPEGVVSLTLYRRHLGQGGEASEFVTYWKGRLTVARLAGAEATLKCEPIASSLKRLGLRARYQIACRHVLYSPACGVAKERFRVEGQVDRIAGTSVWVAAAAERENGYFGGGYLQCAVGARMVTGHSGGELTLTAPMVGLLPGERVQLYAGCDHWTTHCRDRFQNLDNFGGFPFIPWKNPFSGDAIV